MMLDEMLQMGLGNKGWIILVVLYLLFDIVLPLYKKWKQKQNQASRPEPTPAPVPRPTPPPAVRRPVRPPPRAPAPPPVKVMHRPPVVRDTKRTLQSGGNSALFEDLLAPLKKLGPLEPVFEQTRMAQYLARVPSERDFPLNAGVAIMTVMRQALGTIPDMRAQAVRAAGLPGGVADIASIQELVESIDKLAVGWLDTLFADAMSLALLGPVHAKLRAAQLRREGRTNVLVFNVAGGRELRLEPPLCVLLPAFSAGLKNLGHGRAIGEFEDFANKMLGSSTMLRLRLEGLNRPMEFEVDPLSASQATTEMMTGLLNYSYPAMGGHSPSSLGKRKGLVHHAAAAIDLKKRLLAGADVRQADPSVLLLAFADIALEQGTSELAEIRSLGHRRFSRGTDSAPRDGALEGGLLALNGSAIVEGLILGELLRRPGRSGGRR